MNTDWVLGELAPYNVTWTTPGCTDRSAMPLGNGEVGISLWVQADGELHFYIARTDARTECDRCVKLGKVRIKILSDVDLIGLAFRQTLVLSDGRIDIDLGGDGENHGQVQVIVDSGQPTVYIAGTFTVPVTVEAVYQNWRTNPRQDAPANSVETATLTGAVEAADVVRQVEEGILFYHQNGPTIIPFLAGLEAVNSISESIPDCLTHRVFGGLMTLEGAVPTGSGGLITPQPLRSFVVHVTTHSAQTASVKDWHHEMRLQREEAPGVTEAFTRTARWWQDYWQTSWIFVEGDRPVQALTMPGLSNVALEPAAPTQLAPGQSAVTRAYILTRWMFACMGHGAFPILYSGGLFNLMPGRSEHLEVLTFSEAFTAQPDGEPTLEFNPDERGWGHFYLWQNTRLPYASMLARGEADWLQVLFDFYRRFWELDRGRAQLYYGANGQYNTEIVHTFGLQPAHVYGLDRRGKPDGYSENRWGGAVDLSPGLELLQLMLDLHEYRDDQAFLGTELLPYAHDLLDFIATRFPVRQHGKIVIQPIQSVETYWDTTNSLPVVSGLHAVVERILALPPDRVPNRAFFLRFRQIIPEIPVEFAKDKHILAPAASYESVRHNSESPAFYAIFPFRLYGLGRPDLELAIDSFRHASDIAGSFQPFKLGQSPEYPSYSGWQQHGMVAALLGLSEDARSILEHNCALTNPGYRFPAMWGPIYDAVPDIDHGANILTTLQLMTLQAEGSQIRVLPAWPATWDVSFKLHAPHNTTVECVYRQGRIERLAVDPPERWQDVSFPARLDERGDQ